MSRYLQVWIVWHCKSCPTLSNNVLDALLARSSKKVFGYYLSLPVSQYLDILTPWVFFPAIFHRPDLAPSSQVWRSLLFSKGYPECLSTSLTLYLSLPISIQCLDSLTAPFWRLEYLLNVFPVFFTVRIWRRLLKSGVRYCLTLLWIQVLSDLIKVASNNALLARSSKKVFECYPPLPISIQCRFTDRRYFWRLEYLLNV